MAVEVRRANPDDWQAVRAVRLAALQEAPYAFGSSYERERGRAESQWREWIGRPNNAGAVFLAFDGARPVGLDGVYVDDEQNLRLVAMWVEPDSRRTGAGRLLAQAVIDWARQSGADELVLDVTEGNDAAISLYESLGFSRSGRRRTLHSNPTHGTLEMRLPIRPPER